MTNEDLYLSYLLVTEFKQPFEQAFNLSMKEKLMWKAMISLKSDENEKAMKDTQKGR